TENDAEKPGVLNLIAEYNDLGRTVNGKTIVVEGQQKGFFNAREDYRNQYVAGNEPYVFRAARDWVVEFGYGELLAPLEDFFTEAELDDFLDEAIYMASYYDFDGNPHLYGIPQLVDTPALMYNKEVFEQAGINTTDITFETAWTWDEFLEYAELLTDKPNAKYGYTMQGMLTGAHGIFFGHGGDLFRDNIVSLDSAAIGDEPAREAYQFLYDIIYTHNITPAWTEQGWGTINGYFSDLETVAMIQQGPWELRNFLDTSAAFKDNNSKLGIMQLPKDDQGNQGAPLGMHAFVASSSLSGDDLEASVDFIKHMTSVEANKLRAIGYYLLPARESVYVDPEVQAADTWPYIQAFKANVDNVKRVPVHHAWATIETDFANEMDVFLADNQDMDTMIQRTLSLWAETFATAGTVPISSTIPPPTTTDTNATSTGTSTSTPSSSSSSTGRSTASPGFGFAFVIVIAVPILIKFHRRKLDKDK
ncbi:MAG: extracellular solute-binding protein, partial [Candidatus Hodarchaeales archaeon]